MITATYLTNFLPQFGYVRQEIDDAFVFWKRVPHRNPREKMAFSVIFITLDEYTVCIEGMNELLVRRAVNAGAIELESLEQVNLLRDVIYDATIDTSTKSFETIFYFMEKQLAALLRSHADENNDYEEALINLRLLVDAANSISNDELDEEDE
jgi:hypothetical protein